MLGKIHKILTMLQVGDFGSASNPRNPTFADRYVNTALCPGIDRPKAKCG